MLDIIILGITCVFFIAVWVLTNKLNKRRRQRNERINKERLCKELSLILSLSRQLLPLKADMDRLKADVVGRHAVLKIDEFPQQYAFGIEKCCGFEIDWE